MRTKSGIMVAFLISLLASSCTNRGNPREQADKIINVLVSRKQVPASTVFEKEVNGIIYYRSTVQVMGTSSDIQVEVSPFSEPNGGSAVMRIGGLSGGIHYSVDLKNNSFDRRTQ